MNTIYLFFPSVSNHKFYLLVSLANKIDKANLYIIKRHLDFRQLKINFSDILKLKYKTLKHKILQAKAFAYLNCRLYLLLAIIPILICDLNLFLKFNFSIF